jgi:hypothetical protein
MKIPDSFFQKQSSAFFNSRICRMAFSGQLCQPRGSQKDPTVGLDGARPANKCIPPSFLGNLPMQMHCMPTPKSTLSSIKKLANFGKITFLHLKIGESVCQTHFGRQEIYIT